MNDEKLFDKVFLAVFAILLIGLASAYIAAITFLVIPEKNLRFADTTLGFLLGVVVTGVVTTYFSTTREAQRAQQTLATIASAEPAAPAVHVNVDSPAPAPPPPPA